MVMISALGLFEARHFPMCIICVDYLRPGRQLGSLNHPVVSKRGFDRGTLFRWAGLHLARRALPVGRGTHGDSIGPLHIGYPARFDEKADLAENVATNVLVGSFFHAPIICRI